MRYERDRPWLRLFAMGRLGFLVKWRVDMPAGQQVLKSFKNAANRDCSLENSVWLNLAEVRIKTGSGRI